MGEIKTLERMRRSLEKRLEMLVAQGYELHSPVVVEVSEILDEVVDRLWQKMKVVS